MKESSVGPKSDSGQRNTGVLCAESPPAVLLAVVPLPLLRVVYGISRRELVNDISEIIQGTSP